MWYRLEWKKTATARKWIFSSMSGDREHMEKLCAEWVAQGIIARVVEN
jgi:hypothetical protein